MKKKTGLVLLLLALALLAFPATVFAGGTAAAICVQYVEVNSYGYASRISTNPQTLTQTIEGPDASGKTSRFYTDECFHYYLGWDGQLQHPAGVYSVTAYDLPDGYELDDVAAYTSDYPMSVTVTQAMLDAYVAWDAAGEEAGTEEYVIKIPVKKTGTESALLKTPDVPTVKDCSNAGYIYFDVSGSNVTLEIQYSTSEAGTYTTLDTTKSTVQFDNFDELKNGTTYYFRAKAVKTVGTVTRESAYTTPLKVTVKKALWLTSSKPVLKVKKWTSGKTRAVLCSSFSSADYKIYTTFYYSSSKNGTYKKLCTQSASRSKLSASKLSKLKKGKTWYLKACYSVKLSDGTTACSSYSKIIKIKR